jgi:transposase InsO family protein
VNLFQASNAQDAADYGDYLEPAAYHTNTYSGDLSPPPPPPKTPYSPPGTPSVVRIHCKVYGMPVIAIVDSGASHSVLAQSVARKLQLHSLLEPTQSTFLTAGGQKEKPWGVLRDVPITVGRLTLNLEALPVTGAKNYSLLLGNDWLVQAACHMFWDSRKLRFMISPNDYDEVDFDVDGQLRAPHFVDLADTQPTATRTCGQQTHTKVSAPAPDTRQVPVCMLMMGDRDEDTGAASDDGHPRFDEGSLAASPAPAPPALQIDPQFVLDMHEYLHTEEAGEAVQGGQGPPSEGGFTPPGSAAPLLAEGSTIDAEPITPQAPIPLSKSPPPVRQVQRLIDGPAHEKEERDKRAASKDPSPSGLRSKRAFINNDPLQALEQVFDIEDLGGQAPPPPSEKITPCPFSWQDVIWANTHTAHPLARPPVRESSSPPLLLNTASPATSTCVQLTPRAVPNDERFLNLHELTNALTGSLPPIDVKPQPGRMRQVPLPRWPFYYDRRDHYGSEGYQTFSYSWPFHYDQDGNPVPHDVTPPCEQSSGEVAGGGGQDTGAGDNPNDDADLPSLVDDTDCEDDACYDLSQPGQLQEPRYDPPDMSDFSNQVPIFLHALHEELAENAPHELPSEEVEKITNLKYGKSLSAEEKNFLEGLLWDNRDVFAWSRSELGLTHLVTHEIDTGDAKPIASRPYRHSFHEQQIEQEEVEKLLKEGLIEPCYGPWCSPTVLVKKHKEDPNEPDSWRFCLDYRRLNAVTRKDETLLPLIDESLQKVGQSKIYSKIDLMSGFWQVPIDDNSREKSCFCTRKGNYAFKVMPMGLCNSPRTFQRLMQQVLAHMQSYCIVYIDDIIIFSNDITTHYQHLEAVFQRLREANLRASPGKCVFGTDSVEFLGHTLDVHGIRPAASKLDCIMRLAPPTDVRGVRSLLGLVGYYRKFIFAFSDLARPLNDLLKKDAEWSWTQECQEAFEEMRHRLMTAPILARPDFSKQMILQTDYSKYAVAAILSQKGYDGVEHPIGYSSRVLSPAEKNYPPVEGEILAALYGITQYRHILHSVPFILQSDHLAIKWLLTTRQIQGRLARWSLLFQEYTFTVEYRPGKKHINCDSLSRLEQMEDTPHVAASLEGETNPPQDPPCAPALAHPSSLLPEFEEEENYHPQPQINLLADAREWEAEELEEQGVLPDTDLEWLGLDRDSGPARPSFYLSQDALQQEERQELWDDETGEYPMELYLYEGEDELEVSDSVPSDLPCKRCGSPNADHLLVLCDNCGEGEHTYCMQPPLKKVPQGDWFCEDCRSPPPLRQQQQQQARQLPSSPAPLNSLSVPVENNSFGELFMDMPGPSSKRGLLLAPTLPPKRPRTSLAPSVDVARTGTPVPDELAESAPESDEENEEGAEGDEEGEGEAGTVALDVTEDTNLIEFLRTHQFPVDLPAAEKRRIRRRASLYIIIGGLLHKKADGRYPQRVVPNIGDRASIVKEFHTRLGHFGQKRTAQLITEKYWWRGLVRDVKAYVSSCATCQIESPRFERHDQLNPVKVSQFMERLTCDLVGPLPASHPLNNKYIFTCIESASRHAFAYPLASKSSAHVAAAMAHLFGIIGPPRILQTDRGGEFVSSTVQSLLRKFGVKHRMSSAYHPQSQGLVERFNKTITTQLRKYCARSDATMWESYLPSILLGYNCGKQDSTKIEPARLLFGRLPRLPTDPQPTSPDSLATASLNNEDEAEDSDVIAREAVQRNQLAEALQNLEKAQDRQVREYSAKRARQPKQPPLRAGQWVMCKVQEVENKLTPGAHGPYKFVRYSDPDTRRVCVLEDSKNRKWSCSSEHVRPFITTDMRTPLTKGASVHEGTTYADAVWFSVPREDAAHVAGPSSAAARPPASITRDHPADDIGMPIKRELSHLSCGEDNGGASEIDLVSEGEELTLPGGPTKVPLVPEQKLGEKRRRIRSIRLVSLNPTLS